MGRRPARAASAGPIDPRIAPALLRWFARTARPLPWRERPTPYRTWVAEVLLQQTRVAQAGRYFDRFVGRFPDIPTLAAASEAEVLKAWEGAGYYARARHLRAAARDLVRTEGGELPRSSQELARLPGVGPYIAAAVASLAFGEPVVALEVNGLRVGARWSADTGDVRAPPGRARVARALSALLPRRRPGAFNEAVMELGETLCLPRRPRCGECPVARFCGARRLLPDPGSIPRARPRRTKPTVEAAVVALRFRHRWLVQKRRADGLLGGLWEFPGGKIRRGESALDAAGRELREETGLSGLPLTPVGVLRHEYSHFRVRLHLFLAQPARLPSGRRGRAARWVSDREFEALPRPRATIRALERVRRRLMAGEPSPD